MNKVESLFFLGFMAGYLLLGGSLLIRGFASTIIGNPRSVRDNAPLVAPKVWKQSWMNPKPSGSGRKPVRTISARTEKLFSEADAA